MFALTPIRTQSKGDTQILTANFNNMVAAVNWLLRMQFAGEHFNVTKTAAGMRVGLSIEQFPWDKVCFGYKVGSTANNTGDVTIYGGEIQIGNADPVTVANTIVNITVDYSLVGFKYVYATKILTIENFGTAISYTGTAFQKWLYEFRFGDNGVVLNRIGWFNPSLPGPYTDQPT